MEAGCPSDGTKDGKGYSTGYSTGGGVSTDLREGYAVTGDKEWRHVG
jgi:hypothetical protein